MMFDISVKNVSDELLPKLTELFSVQGRQKIISRLS